MEITATTLAKFVSILTCLQWPIISQPVPFLLGFVCPSKHIHGNQGYGFTACNYCVLKAYVHILIALWRAAISAPQNHS